MTISIDAAGKDFKTLGELVRAAGGDVEIKNCLGQRYLGAGARGKKITIQGVAGNALGAYLDGAEITVFGNAQEAVGDTMNRGLICIHGSSGDATGYAMRGGEIYVQGDAGYRAGIHMKAYGDQVPVLVIGGSAGSFLGEYQAGGVIVVLGIGCERRYPFNYFCGAGMHGGKIYVRCREVPSGLPEQVAARPAAEADLEEIRPYVRRYCELFGADEAGLMAHPFYVLSPNTQNPYKQLYTSL